MARLKSRHAFPPYGWKFYQPQTRWELPGNLSFNGAVDAIIAHRKQFAPFLKQYKLSTEMKSVEDELDAFNAARCVAGNWNHFVAEDNGGGVLPLASRLNGNGNADVVALRRNGDILCILPALKKTAESIGRPVRLVVHRDFVSLLDCVSYVIPVPWDGD